MSSMVPLPEQEVLFGDQDRVLTTPDLHLGSSNGIQPQGTRQLHGSEWFCLSMEPGFLHPSGGGINSRYQCEWQILSAIRSYLSRTTTH